MPIPIVGALAGAGVLTIARFLIPRIVGWVLVSLGISAVTFAGVDVLVDNGLELLTDRYQAVPAEFRIYLESFGVLSAINIITSAVGVYVATAALGSFTRFRITRPANIVS